MATQYDPIAKDGSLNTTESPSRNVADVLAEELQNIASAIGGGGGSGGHTIIDPDDTSMAQRAGLAFIDAHISDDSVNDETVVEIVEGISKTDWDNLDPTDPSNNGLYDIDMPNNTPILTASEVGYGTGTVKDALDAVCDYSGKELIYYGCAVTTNLFVVFLPPHILSLGAPSSLAVSEIVELGVIDRTYNNNFYFNANGLLVETNNGLTIGHAMRMTATITWS